METGFDPKQFESLENGKRYTVVCMGDFGFPYKFQMTLESVEYGSYAQYDNCVTLKFKGKGQRKLRGIRFYGDKEFLVYEGWVEVDTEMFKEGSNKSYSSFSRQYMLDARNSVERGPVAQNLGSDEDFSFNQDRVYRVAVNGEGQKDYNSLEEVETFVRARGGEQTGTLTSTSVREAIRDQPKFSNMRGPMYDGEHEGKAVVRYEYGF